MSYVTNMISLQITIALGQDAKQTVVGTVCLDNMGLKMSQEIRVQNKAPLISEAVMIEIIQVRCCPI